jgi:hypothetical protein
LWCFTDEILNLVIQELKITLSHPHRVHAILLITLVHAVNPAFSLSLALGLKYYLLGITCVKADVLSSYLINSPHNLKSLHAFPAKYNLVFFVNYGNFDMTEENGDVTGRFTAADYVFILSWNKMLDSNIYIGANLKPVFCQYESYSSSAIAIDLGVSYQSDDRTWALSFLARNMGTQITRFALADATLPFELQLTASKKLAHAPFVVYLGLNNLQKWNIREEDPLNPRDEVDLSGNVTKENKFAGFTDNLFRHVQAGVEFVPSQHFYIALGYSWKQNREMNLTDAFSIAGLSYGFGINYRQFRIAYSRCEYHRYGSPNFVSLLIKL